MKNPLFTVPVQIDAALFRDFALFDTFRRQRRWVSPLLFAGILTVFALVAFAMHSRAEQAILLGSVLLIVGLGLPAVYLLSFYLSIRTQVKKLQLSKPRLVYTLQFSPNAGVEVSAGKENAAYRWEELYGAYRARHCVYLYAAPRRAYLLPDAQVEGGADRLWALLESALPPRQVHDCRRKPRSKQG